VINLLGYIYLRKDQIDKAISVFKENIKRYPCSANVYDSLGEAYENHNQYKLARDNYQEAYDLGLTSSIP
jgi:tetratricopeptide (TPR) repeat protein